MTVVLGLVAAVLYGIGDFAGGIASRRVRRANSAITVLLWSYPVGAVLMAALLPLFPGHLDGRVLLFGTLGGLAGLLGRLGDVPAHGHRADERRVAGDRRAGRDRARSSSASGSASVPR